MVFHGCPPPLLTTTASAPIVSNPIPHRNASHHVFPKTMRFGGCSPREMMREM